LADLDNLLPEDEDLLLPSSLSEPNRHALGLSNLATIERSLREGQAHDALHDLRIAIQTFNYNLNLKKTNVHGQGLNTRWQQFLQSITQNKVSEADKYRRARLALIALGFSEDDKSLQPLKDNQLWGKNDSAAPALGETKKEEPWFWTVGRPSGLDPVEELAWSLESKLFDLLAWV
jgi:hypothetical protein